MGLALVLLHIHITYRIQIWGEWPLGAVCGAIENKTLLGLDFCHELQYFRSFVFIDFSFNQIVHMKLLIYCNLTDHETMRF